MQLFIERKCFEMSQLNVAIVFQVGTSTATLKLRCLSTCPTKLPNGQAHCPRIHFNGYPHCPRKYHTINYPHWRRIFLIGYSQCPKMSTIGYPCFPPNACDWLTLLPQFVRIGYPHCPRKSPIGYLPLLLSPYHNFIWNRAISSSWPMN